MDNTKNILRYCNIIIECGFVLLIFLVPWWVDTRLGGVMLGKFFVLQVSTLIILWGVLLKSILSTKINIYITPFNLPLLLLLIITILSTIFSICPYLSFWGAYYRYEGLITFVNYVVLFYVVANYFDKNGVQRLLGYIVLSGTIVATYGLLQHFHIDLVGWREYGTQRVISTFGNAVYFGAYLVTVFPLSLVGYLMVNNNDNKHTRVKKKHRYVMDTHNMYSSNIISWLSGIAALLILCGIFVANTRGAFLGFIISIIFFVILTRGNIIMNTLVRHRVILLLVLMICISSYFVLHPEVSPIRRFLQTFSVTSSQVEEGIIAGDSRSSPRLTGGAASRIFMWRDSMKIIADYPLLGTGPETFGMIYSKYRSLDLIRNEGGEYGHPDRVHNDLIDFTITRGLIGLIVYLWFICVIFTSGRRYIKQTSEIKLRFIIIGILSGILGYLVQNQFCFWILPSTSLFFIMAGIISVLSSDTSRYYNGKILCSILSSLLIVGICICFLKTTIPWYKADIEYKTGADMYWSNMKLQSIDKFQTALLYNPKEKLYYEYILHAYLDTAQDNPEHIDKAISAGEKITRFYPLESIFYHLLGIAYEKKGMLDKAIETYSHILTIDPLFGEARVKIANVYIRQNKLDNAVEILEEGLKIIPDYVPFLERLAQIYLIKKDDPKAKEYLQKVVKLAPNNFEAYNNLARIYYDEGRIDLVILQCKEMLRIKPDDINTLRNLGSLYYKQQRYHEALSELNKVLVLNPNDEYTRNLVSRIQQIIGK